ncbi:hypothetical protein EJ04DRAFT_592504 [Polyplosphaeria fusca]|uniref:Dynamin family protein n=1 Tax=Polyplosphaeria fusca TaxID=682080 RepID=A0A9P4V8S3_9PLEO|nr:hypothetical protein EJ04DRAFT_592504 [Polyplosphaeria fusca]
MDVDQPATTADSLSNLHGGEQRALLDCVDNLRRHGLKKEVGLPQIVVCGDQSSGKSSVLEAITEIPFPRKEGLCTRFATEISLRRHPKSSISVTIIPDSERAEQEKSTIGAFNSVITDFSAFSDLIDAATEAMGLGRLGENTRAFSRDVLSVEICGPDKPQLTLVDLPGIIHSVSKNETEADKILIHKLVQEYMTDPRTIILSVISGRYDWQNQAILDLSRKIDKEGRRTLGIITKPDTIPDSDVANWIEVAENKNIFLELGWHMLKNRGPREMDFTFAQRNAAEADFFITSPFAKLSRDYVGIDSLKDRLSELLLRHLVQELPSLKEEISTKLRDTVARIDKLGEKRGNVMEQRIMLTKISTRVQNVLHAAVNGHYQDSFFGTADVGAALDAPTNIRRLRAVVQDINLKFANAMRIRGHKYTTGFGPGDADDDVADMEQAAQDLAGLEKKDATPTLPKPQFKTRTDAIKWVELRLQRSRGIEIPGTGNPFLISQLFWEQSENWGKIAEYYVARVAFVCREFVRILVKDFAPPELEVKLHHLSVEIALAGALEGAKKELKNILGDKAGHPMTYNHYFTTTLQKIRQKKQQAIAAVAVKQAEETIRSPESFAGSITKINPAKVQQAMANAVEQNMDRFSAAEALDIERAYYKDELKFFINVVAKQVIERHLVAPLPNIVLSPVIIAEMPDTLVQKIAAEPPEIGTQRANLEHRKATLEKGLMIFADAMGDFML